MRVRVGLCLVHGLIDYVARILHQSKCTCAEDVLYGC